MVKIKKLTDLAQIDLGLSVSNAEESTSFIDDTDTSSLDSKSNGESSSSGDFFLDYRSLSCRDRESPAKSKNTTDNKQENQAVQFDSAQESVFGGPFSVNEFVAQTVDISARFHEEKKGFFGRSWDRLKAANFWCLLECCFCC